MKRFFGQFKNCLLCVVVALSLTALLCACSSTGTGNNSSTDQPETVTPTAVPPTEVPTPTLGFRDPTVTGVSGYAETGIPKVNGDRASVWKLAPTYWIENTVKGDAGLTVAEFRVLWDDDYLYVQVHILDSTYDTSADSVYERDSVFFFINEDGKKNRVYSVGDACYIVDRDGNGYLGSGASGDRYHCTSYSDGTRNGYFVEASIPLLTITGRYDRQIGFDVRVNNASEGKLRQMLQWSDTDTHTDVTMRGVGLLTLD